MPVCNYSRQGKARQGKARQGPERYVFSIVTDEGSDTGSERSLPTDPRRFGRLPDLAVPDGFAASLPEKAPDTAAPDADNARISVSASDLRRFADTFRDLRDASVMNRAWE